MNSRLYENEDSDQRLGLPISHVARKTKTKKLLVLRCISYSAIPLGLMAWLLLPQLFSLVIILLLAYLDEMYLEERDRGREE